MQDVKYCQSCGMPLGATEELYGTNADGSKNDEYCCYCYKEGKFTADCSMEEMIEFCIQPMMASVEGLTEAGAREMMQGIFPQLKRWKN